ncbi:MAG: hypothetical protein ACK45I_00285 [Bacteroidota bacterium]|jgi:hypothetical protein
MYIAFTNEVFVMENRPASEQIPVIINKEKIPAYEFVSFDALEDGGSRNQRRVDLEKAMLLGNSAQAKIDIVFLTTEGLLCVQTTVWAATDDAIMLKGGISIPVHCIKEIRFL